MHENEYCCINLHFESPSLHYTSLGEIYEMDVLKAHKIMGHEAGLYARN